MGTILSSAHEERGLERSANRLQLRGFSRGRAGRQTRSRASYACIRPLLTTAHCSQLSLQGGDGIGGPSLFLPWQCGSCREQRGDTPRDDRAHLCSACPAARGSSQDLRFKIRFDLVWYVPCEIPGSAIKKKNTAIWRDGHTE